LGVIQGIVPNIHKKLQSIIGGMPLTYVLCPEAEVTLRAPASTVYIVDTDLYHTACLNDNFFKTNNAQLYVLLENVIFDS
jgi:hypothetical protein